MSDESRFADDDDVAGKRSTLYAAILRFSPESGSLRDRALDRLVMAALLGATEEAPLKIGQIQENVRLGIEPLPIRPEIIKQSVIRLVREDLASSREIRTKQSYFLTQKGNQAIEEAAASGRKLFTPVVAQMLQGIEAVCDHNIATLACRNFISLCFARFGQQIAKSVTGSLDRSALVQVIDIPELTRLATEGLNLSHSAIESLQARCISFLKSNETAAE